MIRLCRLYLVYVTSSKGGNHIWLESFSGIMDAVKTRVILLGTGTPNPDPKRSGPSVAIVVDEEVYIVDFGPGIVRRAIKAGLTPSQLTRAFLTHLHSDHTVGYPDLILTPVVAGRIVPLEVYGPV